MSGNVYGYLCHFRDDSIDGRDEFGWLIVGADGTFSYQPLSDEDRGADWIEDLILTGRFVNLSWRW